MPYGEGNKGDPAAHLPCAVNGSGRECPMVPADSRMSPTGLHRHDRADDAAAAMPDLELIDFGTARSFRVRSHGYPHRTVRWHFHPEYEIHLIVETVGRAFVGDYLGRFGPGNLVMTGPDLPHNWISETEPGTRVGCRCIFVQFTSEFIDDCFGIFPEIQDVKALLADAQRGIEFPESTASLVAPVIIALQHAAGIERIELFLKLLRLLASCGNRRLLASAGYEAAPADYMDSAFNHVLAHVRANYTRRLRESELATFCGCSRGSFSRQFHRHTGLTFVQYVNRLRIQHACDLLLFGRGKIADICYESGFNNLSNFNRQFLQHKKMSPAVFRNCYGPHAARSAGHEQRTTSMLQQGG